MTEQPNSNHHPLQRNWDEGEISRSSTLRSADPAPAEPPSREVHGGLTAVPWSAPATLQGPLPWLDAGPASVPPPAGAPPTSPPRQFSFAPVAAPHQQDQRSGGGSEMPDRPAGLAFDAIISRRGTRPTTGWRGLAYRASGGKWNPGVSAAEQDQLDKIARIRTQLPGRHTITVASMKGGIGKTTVSALLGLTLAEYRGDRVVALDANPDAGTLAERLIGAQPLYTVRDLIENLDMIRSTTDVTRFTSLAGRLQVLASEQDPAMSEAFNADEYHLVLQRLRQFYNVIITDSGTGLIHSAMQGALALSNSLVIVGAPTADGASRASKTLDWLDEHGHRDLVSNAVVALSCDRFSRDINRDGVLAHFSARCRVVVEIPADPHLAKGEQIDLQELRPNTRLAAMTLAAHVAEQFHTNHDAEPLLKDRS